MDLLKYTQSDKEEIWNSYGTNEKRIKEDISIIKEWYKKQPHLPQNLNNDDLIQRILLASKFRVEKAKERIDGYYSIKVVYKDIFSGFKSLVPSDMYSFFLPLPELTENQERIIYIQLRNVDTKAQNFEQFMKYIVSVCQLILHFDYAKCTRSVVDFKGVKLEHLVKINATVLNKVTIAVQEGFGQRIGGVECLNAPTYINVLMSLLKKMLKPKVFDRIHFHDNLESLYTEVPKRILPKELGGDTDSIDNLLKQWDDEYIRKSKFFKEEETCVANESLRIGKSKFKNEIFGVEGSFRKLDLD